MHRARGAGSHPADWDDWIRANGSAARFCQTSHWMRIEEDVNGATCHYIWAERDGSRVAAAALSLRKPTAPASVRDLAKSVVPGARPAELACLEGPLVSASGAAPGDATETVLDGIDTLARECGAGLVRAAPSNTLPPDPWTRRGYRAEEWATAVVDLTQSEDALTKSMRQAARKGIRKSREAGLRVEQCRDYDSFARDFRAPYMESIRLETGARRPPRDDRRWWELDGGRHYRFFVAKDREGRVHATLGTYSFGGIAKEIMSGRTRVGRESGIPAQDLLHYEIFLAHKRLGDTAFDLAGFNPNPRDAKEEGIARFKRKWGGDERPLPVFTKRRGLRLSLR